MDNLKSFGQGNCSPGQCECSNTGWEVFRKGGGAVGRGLSKVFVGALHSSPCAAAALWMQNFIHDGSNTQISSINIWEKGFWGAGGIFLGPAVSRSWDQLPDPCVYQHLSKCQSNCLFAWLTHTHTHIYRLSSKQMRIQMWSDAVGGAMHWEK